MLECIKKKKKTKTPEEDTNNLMRQRKEFIQLMLFFLQGEGTMSILFFNSVLSMSNVVLSKYLSNYLVRKSHLGPSNALSVLLSFITSILLLGLFSSSVCTL